ncbi:hypothetical protein HGH93_21485 [Chitinophaga polysaccharea]|uniref:hypothetical protein n=1 Tax=Chitinophaga polysaccharea TaxID=1293035 RepID=UPI0014550795|nr:hypothetical protein [Chitinophaga polysaccharea]NLR60697.1 hypothetical protein [Chitinophaga polysaccharea]
MEINNTEFFRNFKDLPPPGTNEFEQLVNWELEKCIGGLNIAGVHISGWLYFHLNHWYIRADQRDNYGNIIRVSRLPDLRDNEWERAVALEECRRQMKGYMEVGLRQGGKSEFEASLTGYNSVLFRDTQNVIVGGNKPDLELLTDKLDHGLRNIWSGIAIGKIDKDWRKTTVRLGYKDRNNEPQIWSYIMIRNANDGLNTETSAGTTARSYVMDEIGKYLFAQVFEAAKPAFLSEYGWRCIPVLVGTGGSFDKGADAERFFYNPDANNFLGFDDHDGRRTCLFMPGTYRQDCKIETTLDKYLAKEKGIILDSPGELANIIIKVSDKEKALQVIKEERAEKARDSDQTEYLKKVMYYPLTPAECFLSASSNQFNIEAAKKQKEKLSSLNITGTPIEIFHDGEKLQHKFTDKLPISSFPTKATERKDGCIVMYEPPVKNAPFSLYVAGIDPYKQDNSKYSTSLGAVYIYKRMHRIAGDSYQNMLVAQYVGRPSTITEWNETVRNLIKYYNAFALSESDDYGFIQYMINKGDAMYLMEQPEWLKDISANSAVRRQYGIPATPKIIAHINGLLKNYTEETISKEHDDSGQITKEVLGFSRILDPLLLEEMIKYNHDGNFDRIRAAAIAIAVATHLDARHLLPSSIEDPRLVAYFSKKKQSVNPAKLLGAGSLNVTGAAGKLTTIKKLLS